MTVDILQYTIDDCTDSSSGNHYNKYHVRLVWDKSKMWCVYAGGDLEKYNYTYKNENNPTLASALKIYKRKVAKVIADCGKNGEEWKSDRYEDYAQADKKDSDLKRGGGNGVKMAQGGEITSKDIESIEADLIEEFGDTGQEINELDLISVIPNGSRLSQPAAMIAITKGLEARGWVIKSVPEYYTAGWFKTADKKPDFTFRNFVFKDLLDYLKYKTKDGAKGEIEVNSVSEGFRNPKDSWKKIKNWQSDKKLLFKVFSIGDIGEQMQLNKGAENLYVDIHVFDEDNKEYIIELYTKENHAGLKEIASEIIQQFKKGGTVASGYQLELGAVPNYDFPDDEHEGRVFIPRNKVAATDIADAREKLLKFIDDNYLGGGNTPRATLYLNGKNIGYFSYNGALWNKDGTPMTYAKGGQIPLEELYKKDKEELVKIYKDKFGLPALHHDYNTIVAALHHNKRIKHLTEEEKKLVNNFKKGEPAKVVKGEIHKLPDQVKSAAKKVKEKSAAFFFGKGNKTGPAKEKKKTGGHIGFKKLSEEVAKEYAGKSVPKKYQKKYGTVYSREEAHEVGDKVAGTVKNKKQYSKK